MKKESRIPIFHVLLMGLLIGFVAYVYFGTLWLLLILIGAIFLFMSNKGGRVIGQLCIGITAGIVLAWGAISIFAMLKYIAFLAIPAIAWTMFDLNQKRRGAS